jgi:thioredoxin reductase (NADPH)
VAERTFEPTAAPDVHERHDVVVVGAGVAGTNCALECFDIQLDTVVFEAADQPGGQLDEIPHSVRNVAVGTFSDGSELRRSLVASASILGDRLRVAHQVTRADLGERWVEVGGARVGARALVIATGTRRQQLAVALDGDFGGDVTYQLEARPDHFAGRNVVVVGGGDSATLDALELARDGSKVVLAHRSEALTARHDIVEKVRRERRIEDLPGWEVESLQGGERLEGVTLVRHTDGTRRRVDAGGLVVKIARAPRTDLFAGQLEVDHAGAIVVDRKLQTSRIGVFAAGDIVSGAYARVASAMGQGSLAARSVLRFIEGRL